MRLGFFGEITIKKIAPYQYRLIGNFQYSNAEIVVIAKDGLVSDGASIPKVMWRFIGSPFTGRYTGAALIHDALYASEALPRKQCDNLFLEMMAFERVSKWKRKTMYWAVRIGGYFVWEKHTKESLANGRLFCEVI